MHAQVHNPAPSITYDADTEQFTVTVPSFICQETDDQFARDYAAANGAPVAVDINGKDALITSGPFVFDKFTSDYTVEFVLDHHASDSVSTFSHTQVWQSSIDTADACTDASSLIWQSKHGYQCGLSRRLWSVLLKSDGTYTLSYTAGKLDFAGPARANPRTFASYDPDTRALTIYNLQQRVNDAHAVANSLSVVLPVSSSVSISLGKDAATGTLALSYTGDGITLEGYALALAYIETDSDGVCSLFRDYSGYSHHPLYGLTQVVTIDGTNLTFTSGILTGVS